MWSCQMLQPLVVGYIKGREDNESQPNEARKCAKEILKKVREQYDAEICTNLKKNKISCSEIIDFSYNALKEVLDNK